MSDTLKSLRELVILPADNDPHIENLETAVCDFEQQLTQANAEIERLREDLRKYGTHQRGCNFFKSMPFSDEKRLTWKRCTCGLDQALAKEDEK
jgi:hypothetical protein